MGQWKLPASDVSVGGWSDQGDGTSDVFETINDASQPVDDTDYVKSGADPADDVCRFTLTNIYVPAAGTVTIHVRCAFEPTAPETDTPTAHFVWDAVAGSTGYTLQVANDILTPWTVYNESVGNVLSYGLTLAPGTYYWRVVAAPSNTTPVIRTVTV